ncbi:MAG TPA: RIP metalloprotease RseP [Geminicoccaceae bacterium]|nr:RIP metalloprotease RseP [Geminicoccaceae bacterium]
MELISGIGTYLVPFLIILSVVVFVHELGHYLLARWTGVRVDVFSIGFGPELFGITDRAGTRWKFSALPLGGYVKMHGDADPTSSTIDLTALPDPDSFPAKTVGQRMAIVAAGPIANLLFAIVVLGLLFATVGRPFTPAVIGEVQPDSAAAAADLQPGDRITAVGGEPLASFEELQSIVRGQPDVPLTLTIERAAQTMDVVITPRRTTIEDRFGQVHHIGLIGISRSGVEFRRSNPLLALAEGGAETYRLITGTLQALGQIVVGSRTADELGGPLRIAQMSGEIAKDGVVPVIWFAAVLSINLGLINLFPIPLLDGGHLVLYGIEALRGRPLTERSQEMAFRFGLIVVLSLMVFATWNDLVQLNVIEFFKGLVS